MLLASTQTLVAGRPIPQLQTAIRAVELFADTLAKLDDTFPGPGGDAPRAYAWQNWAGSPVSSDEGSGICEKVAQSCATFLSVESVDATNNVIARLY